MRVSSPMRPSLSGTLKSTRMKTRLPFRSRSLIDSLARCARPPSNLGSAPQPRYSPFFASSRSRSTHRFE